MKFPRFLVSITLVLAGLSAVAQSHAVSRTELDQQVITTVTTFNALNAANRDLAAKAAGVLVFPHVTKAGAGVAGEYGEGVLQVDGKTVGYYSTAAGSVGLTLGVAKHSEIIMFMTREALDTFVASEGWSVGADAEVLVVKTGAHGEYDSMLDKKPILAFIFAEKGLMGDLSLVGTKISKMK